MDDKGTIYLILNPKLLKLSFIFSLVLVMLEWNLALNTKDKFFLVDDSVNTDRDLLSIKK